jgi:hypothetical protein
MPKGRITRPRSKPWSLRLAHRDHELLHSAATHAQISKAELIRQAMRVAAERILAQPTAS